MTDRPDQPERPIDWLTCDSFDLPSEPTDRPTNPPILHPSIRPPTHYRRIDRRPTDRPTGPDRTGTGPEPEPRNRNRTDPTDRPSDRPTDRYTHTSGRDVPTWGTW